MFCAVALTPELKLGQYHWLRWHNDTDLTRMSSGLIKVEEACAKTHILGTAT